MQQSHFYYQKVALLFTGLTIFFLITAPTLLPLSKIPIGKKDYAVYWAAYQVYQKGQNPYAEEQLSIEISKTKVRNINSPFWNLPPTLIILSPVLMLPFEASALLWLLLNFILIILLSRQLWFLLSNGESKPTFLWLLISSLFPPYIDNLLLGQMGILVTASVVSCFTFIQKKRDVIAGLCLTLAIIKPHTIYLVFVALLLWSCKTKRWGVLLSFFSAVTFLSFISIMQRPTIFTDWMHLSSQTSEWLTPTFSTIIRLFFLHFSHQTVTWPIWAVPLLASVLSVFYFFKQPIRWQNILPGLTAISIFTAPFGWTFDFALLVIPYAALLYVGTNSMSPPILQRIIVAGLVAMNLFFLTQSSLGLNQYYSYVWFPIFLGLLLWRIKSYHKSINPTVG